MVDLGTADSGVAHVTAVGTVAVGAVAVAAAGLLSGCGISGFSYISHRDKTGAVSYFKVPSDWTVYRAKEILESANGHLTSAQVSQIEAGNWTELFAGGPHPSLKEARSLASGQPTGVVSVRQLGVGEADSYSWSSLRSEILSSDPLNPPNPDPYVVLSYNQFTRAGGLRGSHLVVDIKLSTGLVATLNQVALVNQNTQWVYVMGVSCIASCYGSHQGLISQVVNSWAVKER